VKELTEAFSAEKMAQNFMAAFRADADQARAIVVDIEMQVGSKVSYINKQKEVVVGILEEVDMPAGLPRTAVVKVGSVRKKVQYKHLRPMAADRCQLVMPHLDEPEVGMFIFWITPEENVFAGKVIRMEGADAVVQEYEAKDDVHKGKISQIL